MTDHTRAAGWLNEGSAGVELVSVTFRSGGFAASGVALRSTPEPYRLEYELSVRSEFRAVELDVSVHGAQGQRNLRVERDDAGRWSFGGAPHVDVSPLALRAACDVDLELSPLFNSMPVLRDGLHLAEPSTARSYTMLWIATPQLTVRASRQRYTTISRDNGLTVVRYESLDSAFVSDVVFDEDGLVVDYPQLAGRVFTG